MRRPVNNPFTITTQFGVPDSNALFGYHSGIDFAGFGQGRAIFAPISGQLTNVVSPTGGNMVVIFDGQYYHRLMHNSRFSRGDGPVEEGNQVAEAGTTGLSTGVHCHWDINNQGLYPTSFNAFINPNDWLNQGDEEVKLTDKQRDDIINGLETVGYGSSENLKVVLENQRPLFDSDPAAAILIVLNNIQKSERWLKPQLDYARKRINELEDQSSFEPYSGKELYIKK